MSSLIQHSHRVAASAGAHAPTRARAVLEAHYSDLLAAFDNSLDHLPLFPYFTNYLLLSQLEHGLQARHVPSPPPSRVTFVGSGPLPLSSLVLASRHRPTAAFDNYDICEDANDRARRRRVRRAHGVSHLRCRPCHPGTGRL
jgi:hypothetical protein